jgi:hypothetical protein
MGWDHGRVTDEEFRDFIREERLRHEQSNRRFERWLQAVDRRMEAADRRMEAVERKTDAQIEALRDLIEESRAQRGALLSLIDRLDPGGGPASA